MFLNYLFYIALSLVSSDYQEEKPEKEIVAPGDKTPVIVPLNNCPTGGKYPYCEHN
ncbi:hypothetical protein [Pleionea sp. CnH1-48]|uniref:hypothetical protein n=1 Tax=Pleionea sp. CnH1-48 TaxID=2954494 RepID=UPI0020981683|nr:hypothetical protein [Pleionea sp. CnH1-48]MCO7222777.1 hypothetical protein [Pleionea sp. CnH1-48]